MHQVGQSWSDGGGGLGSLFPVSLSAFDTKPNLVPTTCRAMACHCLESTRINLICQQNYVKKELARISKMKAQKQVIDKKMRMAAQVYC